MKIKIGLLLLFVTTHHLLLAQSEKPTYSFVIKGKVVNNNDPSWSFANTSFLDNKVTEIPIKKNGTFSQVVPIEGIQKLYLYLNDDEIALFAQPNDTIEVNWDAKNFKNTFQLKSPSQIRNQEIQLNLQLYNDFGQEEMSLIKNLWEIKDQPDSIKYRMINDQYNKQLKVVLHAINEHYKKQVNVALPAVGDSKFVYDTYYKHIKPLEQLGLLEKYSLVADPKIVNPENSQLIRFYIPKSDSYKMLEEATFYQSPEYRNFLFDHVRKSTFLGYTTITNVSSQTNKGNTIPYTQTNFFYKENNVIPWSPIWDDYHKAMADIHLRDIRDWFISKVILFGFDHYSFEEPESVLNEFLPKCQSEVYKEILIAKCNYVKIFKKGKPAPNFTLKDEAGKTVSLSEFKGKYVYLDFWEVGCGPCIYEIKNHSPKLYEKYKDKNIVFINICVDADESNWKKALTKYHLDGVNLLSEGGINNSVCKAYNVNGIPHYVLIDQEGNFIEHRATRPSDTRINDLFDKLLEK